MNGAPATLDLDLMREAISTSTLSHALKFIGDRWSVQVLMGAFRGMKRFDEFQEQLGVPRRTLSDRLKMLVHLDILRPRLYQERPERYAYHLTRKGMALYGMVLMIWEWELQFGNHRLPLPTRLIHRTCGHAFRPQMTCTACAEQVSMRDLVFTLRPNPRLPHDTGEPLRTPKISAQEEIYASLALRLDRWSLLIVSAITLGCRYFDQLAYVLRIGTAVLSRRLATMVETGLLQVATDRNDGRRRVYLLTPATRALFSYIILLATWANDHQFHEPSSIRPRHRTCGAPLQPRVTCSHCHAPVHAWDVSFETGERL